jgi:hypothetical protein
MGDYHVNVIPLIYGESPSIVSTFFLDKPYLNIMLNINNMFVRNVQYSGHTSFQPQPKNNTRVTRHDCDDTEGMNNTPLFSHMDNCRNTLVYFPYLYILS